MSNIILIVLVAVAIGLCFLVLRLFLNGKFVVKQFENCNTIVFGKKGTGKDLVFNYVQQHRKKPYYSNVPIDDKRCDVAKIEQFSVSPLTYKDFIDGNISTVEKHNAEDKDFYISDGGVVLPSQYQGELCKAFPSLPIYYALSRHLTNSNIHINTQFIGRPWDKLREQADAYFNTRSTIKIFNLLFTHIYYYDCYESAKLGVRPYKKRLLGKSPEIAHKEDFTALHGDVKNLWIVQTTHSIKYDTRIYHKIVYGVPAPTKRAQRDKHANRAEQINDTIVQNDAFTADVQTIEDEKAKRL